VPVRDQQVPSEFIAYLLVLPILTLRLRFNVVQLEEKIVSQFMCDTEALKAADIAIRK